MDLPWLLEGISQTENYLAQLILTKNDEYDDYSLIILAPLSLHTRYSVQA